MPLARQDFNRYKRNIEQQTTKEKKILRIKRSGEKGKQKRMGDPLSLVWILGWGRRGKQYDESISFHLHRTKSFQNKYISIPPYLFVPQKCVIEHTMKVDICEPRKSNNFFLMPFH